MSRFADLASRILATVPVSPRHKVRTVRFRRLVRNVWGLVDLSEDAVDKLGGEWILDRAYVAAFVARSLDRAREIVFDASVLTGQRCPGLYARLDAVRDGLSHLMQVPATALPGAAWAGEGGGDHLREPEYLLLRGAIQHLALTEDTPPGVDGPRLAEVVSDAHEGALRSLERLRFETWGRRAGRPLVGAGLPGSVRVVDAGGGTAPSGEREWRPRVEWGRIRSAPLRALTSMCPEGDGGTRRGAHVLAVITEEQATIELAWPTGTFVVDACLGEHAAANSVYCALRGPATTPGKMLRAVVDEEGFRRLELGSGLTARLEGRGDEESKRALRRLGEAMRGLVGESAPMVTHNGT